jgi:hypothetical protein
MYGVLHSSARLLHPAQPLTNSSAQAQSSRAGLPRLHRQPAHTANLPTASPHLPIIKEAGTACGQVPSSKTIPFRATPVSNQW